jgi:hypothetical protein
VRIIPTIFWGAALLAATSAFAQKPELSESTPAEQDIPWRKDPSVPRHPGSYLGGGLGYVMNTAWLDKNDDHPDLKYSPLHGYNVYLRVGDAFTEWFSLGFQMGLMGAYGEARLGGFALLLDTAFYPLPGLIVRPNVGLGIVYAQGKRSWELGYGGPAVLSLSLGYELRVTKKFYLCPTASAMWVSRSEEGFDCLTFFFGLEMLRWFLTATG